MRVLGIAGSPRRDGNTDQLLDAVMRGAASKGALVKTIALRDLDYIACQACDDGCVLTGDCKYGDDMQTVYDELERADRIVLASPIQFMGVTAQMKAMIDRCQCLWARKYGLGRPPLGDERPRLGFFVSVGGTREKDLFGPALRVVKTLFHVLDVEFAGELVFSGVDEKGKISERPEALGLAFEAGERLAG